MMKLTDKKKLPTPWLMLLLLLAAFSFSTEASKPYLYQHILITNDDGAEDADRLLALAKHVKSVAKRVSIVVSAFDRSGTSNYTTFGKHQSTLEIKSRYLDADSNIAVYTTSGNPADCVLIGLNGLFGDDRPDLVLSGINGGANIGPRWFGSGTIGAIRTAAFLGVPGVALSGFDDDDPRSFEAIPRWVTQLISSKLMQELGKNSYLTVGFPDVALEEIKGVVIAPRRVSFDHPQSIKFKQVVGDDPHKPENISVWSVSYGQLNEQSSNHYDDDLLAQGHIVITPMTIDENDAKLNQRLQEKKKLPPPFELLEN